MIGSDTGYELRTDIDKWLSGNMSDYLRTHTLTIPQSLHLLSTFISGVCYLHSEPQVTLFWVPDKLIVSDQVVV